MTRLFRIAVLFGALALAGCAPDRRGTHAEDGTHGLLPARAANVAVPVATNGPCVTISNTVRHTTGEWCYAPRTNVTVRWCNWHFAGQTQRVIASTNLALPFDRWSTVAVFTNWPALAEARRFTCILTNRLPGEFFDVAVDYNAATGLK